ncbi:hypothetical protein [Mycolicibacterium alvei]|uniref:Uncharacterized protein n=1 Tax=Mycolicibacterium alvei TaxID=67081 RepID=A0A6N4UUF6_9MYCO|nr:hypothetical protein [Mycolicibacterium alvei]MCV7000935.1 hypothetical protein [Mycolicibacterium alvei]BBX27171.1 hypothetical protein MALV_22960 [Mycolicibacterium alvei]
MLKTFRRIPITTVAYVLLLIAFVSLGLFVGAMALGSDLAFVAGAALIASFAGAVAGFRAGGRKLNEARLPGAAAHNVSMFSTLIDQDQVDRYREMYRTSDRVMAVLPGGESKDLAADSAGAHRRHAA